MNLEEICDIYDEDGVFTGRTAKRHDWQRQEGEYLLAVHAFIRNSDNMYLVQKRADCKKSLPGVWNVTAGMVDAGETSMHGLVREVGEEIGITIRPEDCRLIARVKRTRSFCDIWFVNADFAISDCILQEEEVSAAEWVTPEKMCEIVFSATKRTDAYKKAVADGIAVMRK